jgi:streptogramin lyase
VTALDPAGQEPWAFTYGTAANDSGTGRLIKALRAPATTELWKGELVKNTEAPKITGSPYVGVRLAVSDGKWSGAPLTYGYQWVDCNASGGECSPISGATNANYTPSTGDVGHTLMAIVTATNGGGSVTASNSATALALGPITEFSLPAGSVPSGIVTGPDKNLWFTDVMTRKIGKITTSGTITEYALPPETVPTKIASGPDGNLWFTAQGTSVIGKITTSGTITEYSLPEESYPSGITSGPDGNLWFTENERNTIGKITTSGAITEYWLPAGSHPYGIAAGSDGNLWFTEGGTNKIGKITTSGTITEYALPSGASPSGITPGPDNNLWFGEYYKNTIGKITISGTITEYPLPSGSHPEGITTGPDKNLWFTDYGSNKIGRITTSGVITEAPLPSGSEPEGIASGPDSNLWFTEWGTSKIGKLAPSFTEGELRTPQPGTTIDYNVPLEGSSAPNQMGENPTTHKPETEKWGQTDAPVEATSIFPPDSPQGWPASSYTRATTSYLDEQGRMVNVATPSNGTYGAIATSEYNEENDVTRTLTSDNRASALEAGEKSTEVATLLSTYNTYKNKCSRESEFNEERESAEFGTRLCETEGPEHIVKYTGTKGQEEAEVRGHVRYFYDEKVPAEGPNKESFSKETFNLVTETQNLTEILGSKGRVEEEIEPRTTVTSYSGQNNLGWRLRAPTSVTTDTETGGQKLKSTTIYNEAGQVAETRNPNGESGNSAHDAKIVYYTPENEAEIANCRKHPEWTGLVCQTLPAKQPETSGIPNLPVTETTYNMWNEPEKAIETFTFSPHPTSIRTRKDEYDLAGRLISSQTTVEGNEDKTLPKVTYEYESKQGMQDVESAPIGSKTKTIMSKFNTLGQPTEYSDASEGNIAKYAYSGPEKDFQVQEVSDSSNGTKSRQTYTYNKNTMQLETLWDSAAETFTASYDTEGKLTNEIYPNGMCANYTYNSVGEATHLEYIKTTNCAEGSKAPVWYSETIGSTVRGEIVNRTSTLATENYSYDTLGRLTEAQETPAGGECSVRLYEYEKESNRTKLASRKPGSKGECATTGGTEEKHTYDEANRMTDTGIEYEGFGNITKLPAADAESHELKSTFYVDGAVASQTQNGVTNEYGLDPEGRVLTTATGGKTTIDHYDGAGETVAWACEAATGTETCETGKWTRNIPGIDGALAAVQTNGGTPVLQLHDLEGNVVATAELSSGATKLLSTYNSTEFGVPNKEKTPPPFAWLGAADISKSLSSGVMTYGATSYVPQTGCSLQTLPVESPGYPVPIGGGTYVSFVAEPWNMQGGARVEAEAPGVAAAEQREAEEAAWRGALASAEDPNELLHLTLGEAEIDVLEMKGASTDVQIADVVAMLGSTIVDAGISGIVAKFTSDEIERWMGNVTELLEGCISNLEKSRHSAGACRMSMPIFKIFGSTFPNFYLLPEISWCMGYEAEAKKVHWCYRENLPGEKTVKTPWWDPNPVIA